jgi:hypothetical protein
MGPAQIREWNRYRDDVSNYYRKQCALQVWVMRKRDTSI